MAYPQHLDHESYDCSSLLEHVIQEEAKLESVNDMMDFGHPPPPKLGMFRLFSVAPGSDSGSGEDDATIQRDLILMVAFTKRCISAQVLSGQSASTKTDQDTIKRSQTPFLVSTISDSSPGDHHEQQHQAQSSKSQEVLEELITGLTMVALEDLSLVTVTENLSQVVFDSDPKKRRVQFDEPTHLTTQHSKDKDNSTEQSTARIKNLQLRGFVDEQRVDTSSLQRIAVIFGTNKSRVLSVELRWHPDRNEIILPLSDSLDPLPLDPIAWIKKIQADKETPFCPIGGVNHLSTFMGGGKSVKAGDMNNTSKNADKLPPHPDMAYVWITYGDGTILRIHHSAFFHSVVGDELLTNVNQGGSMILRTTKPTLAERLTMQHVQLLLRCEAKFMKKDTAAFSIVPLPKYHPSPLAPLLPFTQSQQDESTPKAGVLPDQEHKGNDKEDDNHLLDIPEVCEAVLFATPTASAATAESFPTLCFYTSEDQFAGRVAGHGAESAAMNLSDTPILGAVVGGTKAMVGGLYGALTWGFRSTPAPALPVSKETGEEADLPFVGPFPSMRKKTIRKLFAGSEFHDSPRQVESFIVDPEGNLGATTDSFGRVMLFDLSTKQVVRMWKGFREASCCWLQVPRSVLGSNAQPAKKSVYLVIHSKQRRVVEVYRVRHGPRVKSVQVDRDASIVACKEFICNSEQGGPGQYVSSCYIVHSPLDIEKICVDEQDVFHARDETQKLDRQNHASTSAINPKEAALRLQRLQQLLANTNVPCQLQDVHNALLQIKSLKDLATCLDRLAVASVLESKMGVTGSEFQKVVLAYCRESLKEAVKNSKGDPASNPHVKLIAAKIVWHTQVINAFDILRRFELSEKSEEDQQVAPRSPWTEEAMGWVSTSDMVSGKRVTDDESSGTDSQWMQPITFATFASACVAPKTPDSPSARDKQKIEVYLSDSSKTRKEILVHIFKPLLGDIFAFNVVNSIFGALGILEDSEYLLKCFGEWYMTLSTKEAAQKGFFSLYSPMMRWLQEMAAKQLDRKAVDTHDIVLKSLLLFCSESSELVKAFMLGALCREAVAKAAIKKEEKTYGKISSSEKVKKWDVLLRKLRVCLLVSLRLCRVRISNFPITVDHVEQGDIFSVYEWLAHDELALSHNHKEIITLEEACKVSGFSFDPSTEAGDATARFETLQNACLSAALSEEERTEYLVDFDDDDKLGALLLFLKSHNEPKLLVAHRALLLGSIWGQNPHDLSILGNTLVALQSLSIREDFQSLTTAVRLEVWQTRIRPIYRALLFGFHDVQEVSEHIVAPLFHQPNWVREFGRLALEILTLLLQIPWSDSMNTFDPQLEILVAEEDTWPPVKKDFILERLVQRSREVDRSALDMHRVVICALRVSDDIQVIIKCVPDFHECFDTSALYQPVLAPTSAVLEHQTSFLENAILTHAQRYSGPVLESFALGDIETLGAIWKFDMKNLRTTFFLAMYEFGKDRLVDELLTKSATLIQVERMVNGGVDIVCRRLNDLLYKRKPTPEIREVKPLLNADTCGWLQERAEQSQSIVVFSNLQVPVGNTHLFTLRLLSLCRTDEDVTEEIRRKLHPLIVLTGQLVKSLEGLS